MRMGESQIEWTPVEWMCCHFPYDEGRSETHGVDEIVEQLQAHIDTVTEADTSALGKALHVAHILVTMQGQDGGWPRTLNLRTGMAVGGERTVAPVAMLRRMNAMLGSTEFDMAIFFADSGGKRRLYTAPG
jgi:hypothetical protein